MHASCLDMPLVVRLCSERFAGFNSITKEYRSEFWGDCFVDSAYR